MTEDDLKRLAKDEDGLLTYEYIANHIADEELNIAALVENMIRVDRNGQFCVSAARYLAAIDREGFALPISNLAAAAIEKDRERAYIADLLPALWGADYEEHADELRLTDDNFRRIYRRIIPENF